MLRFSALLALCLIPPTLSADNQVRPSRQFDQTITLTGRGDASDQLRWQLPVSEYQQFKERLGKATITRTKDGMNVRNVQAPSAESVRAYLNLDNLDVLVSNTKVTLDDVHRRITANFAVSGWARTTGRTTWTLKFLDNARWYEPLQQAVPPLAGTLTFKTTGAAKEVLKFFGTWGGPIETTVRGEVKLPPGATLAKLVKRDDGRWAVNYRLKPTSTKGDVQGEVKFALKPRHEVVPALHKLYGDATWSTYALARTQVSNPTINTIRNVRLRIRVITSKGKTDWTEWEEVANVVVPGQSVQYPLHPLLNASPLMLTSSETAKLAIELEYKAGEKKVTRNRLARLTILGRNDTAYTALPFNRSWTTFYHNFQEGPVVVTAFVTPNDPVVKDLKGRLARRIGGASTTQSDDGALRFAKAIYDYFRVNISYSSPAGTNDDDGKVLQHLNYARDVLKTGSGTCIDLAITYASIAEAAGIQVGVCLIPGHAFPVVILPVSKRLVPVETTLCGKGTLSGSSSFAMAVTRGEETLRKIQPVVVAPINRMRRFVSAPELPGLKQANPLIAWGRTMPPTCPTATVGTIKVKHNVAKNNTTGMEFTFPVTLAGVKDQAVEVYLVLTTAEGKSYLDKDKKPIFIRVPIKAHKETKVFTMVYFYPYTSIISPTDGLWYEYGVRAQVWNPAFNEQVMLVSERMVMQRNAPAKVGETPEARSIIFVTRNNRDKASKTGVELLIKDVQIGTQAGTANVVVVGGPKWTALKTTDDKPLARDGTGKDWVSVWFTDEELNKAGAAKAKGLGLTLNFWDSSNRKWQLPKAVTVALKR